MIAAVSVAVEFAVQMQNTSIGVYFQTIMVCEARGCWCYANLLRVFRDPKQGVQRQPATRTNPRYPCHYKT